MEGYFFLNSDNAVTDLPPPWEDKDRVPSLVTQAVKSLAGELYQRIYAGQYSFGTRLPSERQLVDEFGVSRNTIRQALDLLENHEIVSRRHRSGCFVVYRVPEEKAPASVSDVIEANFADIAEITSPLELNVVRSIVEPEIIRLAVLNMSTRDILELKKILARLEGIKTNASEFALWDERFHLELAKGTHNPLLIAVYQLVNHVRRNAQWARNVEKTLSPNRIKEYQKKHRSVCEAIEARDMESAVEFIRLHMTELQRDLMTSP